MRRSRGRAETITADIEEGGERMETTGNFADQVRAAIHAFAEDMGDLVEKDPQVSNRLRARFVEETLLAENTIPEEGHAREAQLRRLLVMALFQLIAIGDPDWRTRPEDMVFGGPPEVDDRENDRENLKARIRDHFSPSTREDIFAWEMVREEVRTFAGSMQAVDDDRWLVVYRVGGELYKTHMFSTRALAEHDLVRTKDALLATGWHLLSRGE